MAPQVAFLANASLCLIGFYGGWQGGAKLALLACVAYALHIGLLSIQWNLMPSTEPAPQTPT